jgi:hypothetical protein
MQAVLIMHNCIFQAECIVVLFVQLVLVLPVQLNYQHCDAAPACAGYTT